MDFQEWIDEMLTRPIVWSDFESDEDGFLDSHATINLPVFVTHDRLVLAGDPKRVLPVSIDGTLSDNRAADPRSYDSPFMFSTSVMPSPAFDVYNDKARPSTLDEARAMAEEQLRGWLAASASPLNLRAHYVSLAFGDDHDFPVLSKKEVKRWSSWEAFGFHIFYEDMRDQFCDPTN